MRNLEPIEVKFSDWIQQGFNLYKDNIVLLLVAGLITSLVGGISLGILAGPLAAGLIRIVLGLIDKKEPKPEFGDVFKGFEVFLNAFLLVLILIGINLVVSLLAAIPCLGFVVGIVVPVAASILTMFSLYLIAEHNLPVKEAIIQSAEVVKSNPWNFLGFGLVASVLSASGAILCGIGVFATMPIGICVLAVAYREIFPVVDPSENAVIDLSAAQVREEPTVDLTEEPKDDADQ